MKSKKRMKIGDNLNKIITIIITLLIGIVTFYFGFNYTKAVEPKTYYQVYLDDQVLGVITSKTALEKYIDKQGEIYKKKYDVNKVYAPNGIEIKKIATYNEKTDRIQDVYKKIAKLKSFTIKGYQFTIKGEEKEDNKIVYVTTKDIFTKAATNTITTFVGTDEYEAFLNDTQVEIKTTGTIIQNVYIDEDITVKEVLIPVDQNIYTNAEQLSQFLLFGTDAEMKTYTVKIDDTIEKIAYNNQINVREFFISNPEYSSEDSLLFPGQKVKIGYVRPMFSVVIEKLVVEDKESNYQTEEIPDDTMVLGDRLVIQEGENGLERVTSRIKTVNGEITYFKNDESTELKPTTPKKVKVGSRYQSNVGTLYTWKWPTNNRYQSSGYEWRYFNGRSEFHQGLDIWDSYGAPIYAANNGTIMQFTCHWSYGNCLVINHNNGYYTLYAHMSSVAKSAGQTVGMGDVIGYVGMTGQATGPHLHYEVWVGGEPWNGGHHINPWSLY